MPSALGWIGLWVDNEAMTVDRERARVSHRDRLWAVRALRNGARTGRLSEQTFMHRLQIVNDARRRRELHAAVADLPPVGVFARVEAAVRARWSRLFRRRADAVFDVRLPPAPGRYVIGRDARCDLRLTHNSVSRRHAVLYPVDGQWMLVDLGSTNGTRLNGWRLRKRAPVHPGDVVALGGQRLRIVASSRPPHSSGPDG